MLVIILNATSSQHNADGTETLSMPTGVILDAADSSR